MLFGFGKPKLIRYLQKNPKVKTVLVAGSYGRKSAIRSLGIILGQKFAVSFGYNPKVQADIILLDYESAQNMPEFSPDVTVVTAARTDAEAQKYFSAANHSKATIINICDVPKEFMHYLQNENAVTYGDELPANYYFENTAQTFDGQEGDIVNLDGEHIPIKIKLLGEHNVRPVLMACAVARFFGMERAEILEGIANITPIHGRMSPARGINGSYIIDDSADGTPNSVKYGLRAIYSIEAPARAIVIGDLSELEGLNYDMLSDVLVLTDNPPAQAPNEDVNFFSDELSLINYLGQRAEENGIILLEIPLPEIIEGYLW